jgi:hypothetical protein
MVLAGDGAPTLSLLHCNGAATCFPDKHFGQDTQIAPEP